MNKHILEIARREGVAPEQVYADIQAAIEAAWATDDPQTVAFQQALFTEQPDPDTFVQTITSCILSTRGGMGG